jgi:guanylate kinase
MSEGKIFILSGPSGSGKTTLAHLMLKQRTFRNKLVRSISFTTRKKRTGEQDKRDYYFISEDKFKRMRKDKKILEWTRYLGYYYGTAKDFVIGRLEKGKSLILCLDVKGAKAVKKLFPRETVMVFIKPPSFREIARRIQGRCVETAKEEISKRVAEAKFEIAAVSQYDYAIVNKDLKKAAQALRKILKKHLEATLNKRGRHGIYST